MDDRESVELVAAFAVGAILGVGATLLLRSEPSLPHRLTRRLEKSGRRLSRRAQAAGRGAGDAGEALASTGREVLHRFRGEVEELVSAAREQLAQDVYDQLRGARREARGERRRWHGRSRH